MVLNMSETIDRDNRTAVDFNSPDDLLQAMQSMDVQKSGNENHVNGNEDYVNFANPAHRIDNFSAASVKKTLNTGDSGKTGDAPLDPRLDWVLESYDEEATDAQTLDEELKRLLVLKSYLLLDSERQESFERITAIASRLFKCPMALISLVDLGRQWFLSNRGLGDVRETDRKSAFCAHAIWATDRLFIVPDATKDFRFKDNPLVTGPPDIRFYAGAPLISPEGYKLGTLCILDRVARPDGLSSTEEQNLIDLASMAVKAAVDHKRVRLQEYEDPRQLIAYTAHDLMTPLTGVQISLSLLSEDKSFSSKTNEAQRELIHTASECTDVMGQICQTAISSFRSSQQNADKKRETDLPSLSETISSSPMTEIKLSDFATKLQTVMTSFPKSVPFNVSVHESVPPIVVSDDLKVFRAAINYLTNACSRTKEGAINFSIKMIDENNRQRIRFECEDTGPSIPVDSYSSLFRPFKFDSKGQDKDISYASLSDTDESEVRAPNSALGLYSVATHISSLGGEYGFRPLESASNDGSETNVSNPAGSVFWFQIPLILPSATSKKLNGVPALENESQSKPARDIEAEKKKSNDSLLENGKKTNKGVASAPVEPAGTSKGEANGATDVEKRKRKALVIEDSMVVRKSLTRALTKVGFEVTQAVDGMEGLRELQCSLFDVVLCDFLMPVMDGLDCVQQYREWEKLHRPFFKQYIIGISAHAGNTDVEKGKEVGMDDFKPKPVTFKQLVELSKSETLAKYSSELDSFGQKKTEMLSAGKLSGDKAVKQKPSHVCLIAMSRTTEEVELLKHSAEERGWKSVVVGNGEEALKLMKLRTWDVILLDEDLPLLPSGQCVARFREWESMNRIMKQRNVALVSASCASMVHNTNSMMQLPFGVDFAMGKPIQVLEFEFTMSQVEENSLGFGSSRDIVAR
mmetsp:Transcript_20241/g.49642  ORF Transcript_20241/g.49642 Transcript_20241/m.49642 type:complete len:920 (+) Transcript_20241:32-2791(+)|eukprot:CAMPEP_0113605818 /NCGR_PEP_ID=MMETSP0017_2-20120614/2531_1 /TAXON_ID=2856 /ORGANISM="Cylindrotheca closterium" /LENGTH=919 /DNA_ID=CAMNT_0000514335 /DNA_START=32 /DNA_END=2791 /DNA_ORIENTATION=- /assembly_acc=CAM_ASM_000147